VPSLRWTNRQLGHVGNTGDILKHAALVELAAMLARDRPDVSFVDTHAFQLHAPQGDEARAQWERDVKERVARHPAYDRYAALERDSLEKISRYRCSSGLMLDALGPARVCAVLAESNAHSRSVIASQLAAEHLENAFVVDDAARVDDAAHVPAGGALLVHVDPFVLTPELWSQIAPALSAMSARSAESAFVLYRYSRNARTPWPAPPARTIGPLMETRDGPHAVVAYASAGLVDAVRDICARLGWIVARADKLRISS
jgi:23S rRNA A2030 N6-methylase RlmJ